MLRQPKQGLGYSREIGIPRTPEWKQYMPNSGFISNNCRKTESVVHTIRSMEVGFDLRAMEVII